MSFSFKRTLLRTISPLVSKMPVPVRVKFLRSFLKLPNELPEGLVFKIAETKDELEQAFQVLHNAFLERSLIDSTNSGIRVTKYHALPSTTIIIAKLYDEVIGTVSVVGDNPLGLPLEELWNIDHLRKRGKRIAEISSLAIKRDSPYRRGFLMFPTFHYVYNYIKNYHKVDYLVIATHPQVKDFYTSMYHFDSIDDKVRTYSFVNEAKAYGQYVNIQKIEKQWRESSEGVPDHQNIYKFQVEKDFGKHMVYPKRSVFKVNDPVMTPEMLDYFFCHKENLFSELTYNDVNLIKSIYFYDDFKKVISGENKKEEEPRRHARFAMSTSIRISHGAEIITALVVSVSRDGLEFYCKDGVELGVEHVAYVDVGPGKRSKVKIMPLRVDSKNHYGCEIIEADQCKIWNEFIDHLESDFRKNGPVKKEKDQQSA